MYISALIMKTRIFIIQNAFIVFRSILQQDLYTSGDYFTNIFRWTWLVFEEP